MLTVGLVVIFGCNSEADSPASETKGLIQGECNTIEQTLFPDRCLNVSGPAREYLAENYPSVAEGSERVENKKILCPFLRLLERAGLFDEEGEPQTALSIPIYEIALAAREFGCSFIDCGGVATIVSFGQSKTDTSTFGWADLEKLHKADGIAHECGFTFAKGGDVVDDSVRAQSLARLKSRANAQGQLTYEDIKATKLAICADQGVEISEAAAMDVDAFSWDRVFGFRHHAFAAMAHIGNLGDRALCGD
jgi:hypothetical protein